MGLLVLAAVLLIVGYLVSLILHPYELCKKCKGTGIHRGSVFTYATRPCTKCGGVPRRARTGVSAIFRGGMVWGERKPREVIVKRAQRFGR